MPRIAPTLALLLLAGPARAGVPFAIEVVDDRTGRGVPLVELKTVNEIRLVTDSRGIAAFDEPGLMGRKVFFHVRSHGYEFPGDGFGYRGKALDVAEGGRARLEVRRVNVAERLYRVTGGGIYRDTLLIGEKPPTREPALAGMVLGQDSVQSAVFGGKIRWFWGDTNRPGYPLGNFQSPTATSRLPGDGGLDPDLGVDLEYAVDADGFARPAAPMPGPGPTWIDGLAVVKDASGAERLFCAFAKVRPPMEIYARGIAEFDPAKGQFARVAEIPAGAAAYPFGHTFRHSEGGVEYVYFGDPFPTVRVPATAADLPRLDRYEAFTCLLPGSTPEKPEIDRDADGAARHAWRRGARPVDGVAQARLVKLGVLKADEGICGLVDVETGRAVVGHRGSTYRNDHRGRWVMVATEVGGESSQLGEVWYAEAGSPLGPWGYARKVVTHDKYSFYNPRQHPPFAKEDGRRIYFEGTYTTTFSGSTDPTPRYDYNQVMYRLDLDDPRLNLPVPIGRPAAFHALERPGPGTVPVGSPARFHALPADAKGPAGATVPLFEAPGEPGYALEGTRAIGRVWRNPSRAVVPAG